MESKKFNASGSAKKMLDKAKWINNFEDLEIQIIEKWLTKQLRIAYNAGRDDGSSDWTDPEGPGGPGFGT